MPCMWTFLNIYHFIIRLHLPSLCLFIVCEYNLSPDVKNEICSSKVDILDTCNGGDTVPVIFCNIN